MTLRRLTPKAKRRDARDAKRIRRRFVGRQLREAFKQWRLDVAERRNRGFYNTPWPNQLTVWLAKREK